MNQCQFAGRHTPPPGHDGYADYHCTVCDAKVRPAILTGAAGRCKEAPPPGFNESIRFVVQNPNNIPLPPGDYIVTVGDPNRLTGIVPLVVVRNVTDDRK